MSRGIPARGHKPKAEVLEIVAKAIENKAAIWAISAEDAAECERSIEYLFSPEESSEIYKTIAAILAK